jgi:hypothetical protein
VQEEEGTPTAGDRTGILRFPVGEQEGPSALRFVHHWRGVFSSLLEVPHPRTPSLGGREHRGVVPLRRLCPAPRPVSLYPLPS